ncbi:MAG: hypothetical protein ACOYL6_16075 [Bacteriovoracaceae bacterium]
MKILTAVLFSLLSFSALAHKVEFFAGDRIIDQYGNTGVIDCVFNNNTAEIYLDQYSGSFVRNLTTLGKGYRCIEKICVGRKIVDQYGNTGRIKELFHTGMAKISLDQYSTFFTRNLASLGFSLKCLSDDSCNLESDIINQ